MATNERRIFNLMEANELVPLLAKLTEDVVGHLEEIRRRYRDDDSDAMPEAALREVEKTLESWSSGVTDLGAAPKGYFTADFQTMDPEVLYCWTYGEERISFTHKVWENFSHRRRIGSHSELPGEHMKWVH